MTDIRDAITALRTLLEALPEDTRRPWVTGVGAVWTAPAGDGSDILIADAVGFHDEAEQIAAHIATVASPDVTEALARLLDAVANQSEGAKGGWLDRGIEESAAAVAAAITRRSTT